MATTTNYGWTTPDDTALVKDGASAIRSLGTSIDTTTKALNPSTTLGDIEYRSSTANTNTRLAIGSTGNILTVSGGVPVWAAPAAASSGLNLLNKTTLSSTTNVSLDNVFSATYDNYKILFEGSVAAGGANISMRLRVGGADNSTSNYNSAQTRSDTSATATQAGFSSANSWRLGATNANESAVSLDIFRPFATRKTNFCGTFIDRSISGGGANVGYFDATTSFDGFSIFFSDPCVGTLSVYGYGI